MEWVEAKIWNARPPICDNTKQENIYCSTFGDDDDVDEIIDAKADEINED